MKNTAKKIATFKEFHRNLAEGFATFAKVAPVVNTFTPDDDSKESSARQNRVHKNNRWGKLPYAHEKAIQEYSSSSSEPNNWLHKIHRDPSNKSNPNFNYSKGQIDNLDKIFTDKKNHVGIDHEVFTGLPESPEKVFKKDRENNPNHDPAHVHVHLPAFTSTSTRFDVATDFAKSHRNPDTDSITSHVLHIRVPKGHPSMSIKDFSEHPEEEEVLLHRGTRLKIHANPDTFKHKGFNTAYKIWHADVVGHKPDDLETK